MVEWTKELCDQLLALRREHSIGQCAKILGVTRSTISGKLRRLAGKDAGRIRNRSKHGDPGRYPAHQLIEPYAQFKLRRKRERELAKQCQ